MATQLLAPGNTAGDSGWIVIPAGATANFFMTPPTGGTLTSDVPVMGIFVKSSAGTPLRKGTLACDQVALIAGALEVMFVRQAGGDPAGLDQG